MFWVAVAVGVAFVIFGRKISFYWKWATFFNVVMSIYMTVVLAPTVVAIVPEVSGSRYNRAAFVMAIALLVFLGLQKIVATYLNPLTELSFPGIFRGLAGVILGFFSGYLVCSFVFFVICIMPFSRLPLAKKILGTSELTPTPIKAVAKVSDFVGMISMQVYNNSQQIIDWLTKEQDDNEEGNTNPDEL